VELGIGAEKFAGEAHFLDSESDRGLVLAAVKRKYWMAAPMFAVSRLFAALGLGASNFGAFEVSL
jgi:hypothetical protein